MTIPYRAASALWIPRANHAAGRWAISDLVEEHHAKLHRALDEELKSPTDAAPNGEVSVELPLADADAVSTA